MRHPLVAVAAILSISSLAVDTARVDQQQVPAEGDQVAELTTCASTEKAPKQFSFPYPYPYPPDVILASAIMAMMPNYGPQLLGGLHALNGLLKG